MQPAGVPAGAAGADAAGATRAETLALARALRPVPALVTVDVEGGFAERPDAVAALAAELARAGQVTGLLNPTAH